MKKTMIKKSLMSLAAVAMMLGVAAPAMADQGGDNDFRIRVRHEGGFIPSLGFGSLGLHNLSSLGLGGFPFLGGLSSLGLGGVGLGGFGIGDNAVNVARTVSENFSSIPSAISISRVPGSLGF